MAGKRDRPEETVLKLRLVGLHQNTEGEIPRAPKGQASGRIPCDNMRDLISRPRWRPALRLRRLTKSTFDQVHISSEGEYAIIEDADSSYGKVNLNLGPEIISPA